MKNLSRTQKLAVRSQKESGAENRKNWVPIGILQGCENSQPVDSQVAKIRNLRNFVGCEIFATCSYVLFDHIF